jgi:hypothetical protein
MENGRQPITPILDLNKDLSGMWGFTKREYFAGLAMQGMLSNSALVRELNTTNEIASICNASLLCADELLKQLPND